jgi:hypothetical protein
MRFPIQMWQSVVGAEVYGFCLHGKLVQSNFIKPVA